jgi:hypothetical protein
LGAEEFCTGRELEVIDFDRTRNLMLAGVGGPGVLHDGASDDGLPPVRADRPVRVVINRVHSHPSWDGMLAKPFDILRKKFSVLRKWNARLQARLARRSGSHLAAVALTAVPFGLYNLPYALRAIPEAGHRRQLLLPAVTSCRAVSVRRRTPAA